MPPEPRLSVKPWALELEEQLIHYLLGLLSHLSYVHLRQILLMKNHRFQRSCEANQLAHQHYIYVRSSDMNMNSQHELLFLYSHSPRDQLIRSWTNGPSTLRFSIVAPEVTPKTLSLSVPSLLINHL